MQNAKLLIATLFGTLLLVVAVSVFFSQGMGGIAAGSEPVDSSVLLSGSPHAIGGGEDGSQAKVTVVEFSDFQCPACRASEPVVQSILSNYPDEVRFVYRHFPLIMSHPNAVAAARASEAAAKLGKFWEMRAELFVTQTEWQDLGDPKDKFTEVAEKVGLEKEAFMQAYEDPAAESKVMSDLRLAEQLGLRFTPTFFLDGEVVPVEQLQGRIAEKLASQQSVTE